MQIGWLAMYFAVMVFRGSEVSAYELKPASLSSNQTITELEAGLQGWFWSGMVRRIVTHFSNGVHEEITNRIWGCELGAAQKPDDKRCLTWQTPAAVLFGVQWNDNPTFKLDETASVGRCTVNRPIRLPDVQPACWYVLFGDAAKRAARGEKLTQEHGFALLYRTHFGDLQFMHSMASWNKETMKETRDNVLMWAEFTYKVATGEISSATKIGQISIPGFDRVLGRYWGDVASLFTYGAPEYSDAVGDVAFGSLLHMLQDSFSRSHASREMAGQTCSDGAPGPDGGRLAAFYAYGSQDSDSHGAEDNRKHMISALVEQPKFNVVTVGRHLKQMRDAKTPWETVNSYLRSCVFFVAAEDEQKPAGPGPFK
jgi:hypothetical protein